MIQRLHQENEKLFERLTERRMSASSPRVSASPKVGFSTSPMCRKLSMQAGGYNGLCPL